MKKDTRVHFTNEPLTFALLSGVWRTGTTMCKVRRSVFYITGEAAKITCPECIPLALEYWSEQANACRDLIIYAETGQLHGTSAEKESVTLVPKLREAQREAEEYVTILTGKD